MENQNGDLIYKIGEHRFNFLLMKQGGWVLACDNRLYSEPISSQLNFTVDTLQQILYDCGGEQILNNLIVFPIKKILKEP